VPSVASLFSEHARYVGRLLRFMGVRESDLEDACQEVFMVAHRKIETLRPEASPRAWLYGICVNEARQRRRTGARHATDELDSQTKLPVVESSLEQRRTARQTSLALLAVLDEDKREVFLLHDVEQLPMREICEALSIPLQTGYSRLRLGRERLQAAVAQMKAQAQAIPGGAP
jgi:RNA polymerase sigma-70 factor (ECF subfamily)